MYLSDKKADKPREPNDHEDLEVLLESFAKQVEEIVNEAETISVSMIFLTVYRFIAKASIVLWRVMCNRHKRLWS